MKRKFSLIALALAFALALASCGGGQTDGGKYCHEDDSDTLHIDLVINFGAKVGKKIEKSHPRRKK